MSGVAELAPAATRGEQLTDRTVYLLLAVDLALLISTTTASAVHVAGFVAVLAATGGGGAVGLLFAIPKRRTGDPTGGAPAGVATAGAATGGGQAILANTSLEEVSDWLTKTIVGVGLVKWTSALAALDYAGARLGAAMFPASPAAALPVGVAVILAATLLGAISSYLWFYRHLPAMFVASSRDSQGGGRIAAAGLAQTRTDVAPATPTAGAAEGGSPSDGGGENPSGADRSMLAAADDTGAPTLDQCVADRYALLRTRPKRVDDWCKGMFGGSASASNAFGSRVLAAEVSAAGPGRWTIRLTVTASPAPEGPAVFFLHNTFPQTTPRVSFDDQGRAVLVLSAWGAFTVGVLTDDGTTELELDLAVLSGISSSFRDA